MLMKKFLIILLAVAVALLCCGCFGTPQESPRDIEIKEEAYRQGYEEGWYDVEKYYIKKMHEEGRNLAMDLDDAIEIWERLTSLGIEEVDDEYDNIMDALQHARDYALHPEDHIPEYEP